MNIGTTVEVFTRRNPFWGKCCVGLIGTITKIDDSVYTDWKKRHGAETKYIVRADNTGPLMKSGLGKEKKVYSWQPNNTATFYKEELRVIK